MQLMQAIQPLAMATNSLAKSRQQPALSTKPWTSQSDRIDSRIDQTRFSKWARSFWD
jgi:hypothetical protein